MFNFKNSLAAFAGVSLFVCAVATSLSPASETLKDKGSRSFYLTTAQHNGSQVLTACAEGYHMASLWEILDPSNLRYDTTLGFVRSDSGSGPPAGVSGWIRTGNVAGGNSIAGLANCGTSIGAWTSANASDQGTTVFLAHGWQPTLNGNLISPWIADTEFCNGFAARVWCVQD
jgi:hypothetical protein